MASHHQTAEYMQNQINKLKLTFLNMNSEERLRFINRYDKMTQIERVVLIQCKKYMSTAEKKVYKQVTGAEIQVFDNQAQPE